MPPGLKGLRWASIVAEATTSQVSQWEPGNQGSKSFGFCAPAAVAAMGWLWVPAPSVAIALALKSSPRHPGVGWAGIGHGLCVMDMLLHGQWREMCT